MISDLRPGMVLEGTVTNVAAFGAFVDIGVHQDGLVHVSALANRFVSDPREVVKSGQVVRVKVLEADPERKRISLTLRLDDEPAASGGSAPSSRGRSGERSGGSGGGSGGSGGSGTDASRQPPQAQRNAPPQAQRKAQPQTQNAAGRQPQPPRSASQTRPAPSPVNTAMAEALRKAGLGK
jgi:uncharacterized protein